MNAQLPRRALAWLLVALLGAILPHAAMLPGWVLAVVVAALYWRHRIHLGHWSFPWRSVKALLVLSAFVAVAAHFRTLRGLEPAVSLLVIAGSLKCMELKAARDVTVIAFVAWFLIASTLLFAQDIPTALYALGATAVVAAALIARHQREADPRFPHPLRLAATMLAQALPLMLLLFLVFPRLAPLWAIPQNPTAARTGPSDSMSPGDITRLGQSSALALRASFDGPIPPNRELYWRGLVFSEFDGRSWRPGGWSRSESEFAARGARRATLREPDRTPGRRLADYEVILEPSNQYWAYVIGYPVQFDATLRLGSDYRLMSTRPLAQRLRYRVRAELDAGLEPQLTRLRRHTELALPEGFNPRALELARAWRAAATDDRAFIARVLGWFRVEPFVYTLKPPALGRDSVDDFLFRTRRGFCEHYASAFTVLLRAAGIPARVVVGYQGGERNPFEDYLLVHQYDAHAWAEAWLEGQGWVRFDPTAAVAPGRIENGLEAAVGNEFLADSPLSVERYGDVALLAMLRMRWDLINYQWAQVVLRYDAETQFRLLERLLGQLDYTRIALALLACGGTLMALLAASVLGIGGRHRHDPLVAAFLAACARLEAAGLARRSGEGALDFARRAEAWRARSGGEFAALARRFYAALFGAGAAAADGRRELARALRRYRPGAD